MRRIRRGAGQFLAGKVLSAVLTFACFALVARLLGASDYGAYAAVLAGGELLLSLSTLGMDWAVARFLPECRTRGSAAQLTRFVVAAAAFQGFSLGTIMLLVALAAHGLSGRIGVPADFLVLYAGVMFIEGLTRVLRDQMLAGLLAQRAAQASAVLRSGLLLLLLVLHPWIDPGTVPVLVFVGAAEGVASMGAFVLCGAGLTGLLRRHRPDTGATGLWHPPAVRDVARVAAHAYASMLLVMPSGGPLLTLVLNQFSGAQAAGAFGFARGLVEQVRRFLPVELFLGLLRPGLVARYAQTRDFGWLNRRLGLLYALSVAAAMPVIALLIAQAPVVADAVGGASFVDAAPILALWSATLLLFPHRRTVEIAAHTVDRSSACVAGGLALAVAPLLVIVALVGGAPVTGALVTVLAADAAFSAIAIWVLRNSGFEFAWRGPTIARLLALQAVACALLVWLPPLSDTTGLSLLAAAGAATVLTWGLAALLKPFAAEDRELIMGWLRRPWFPF